MYYSGSVLTQSSFSGEKCAGIDLFLDPKQTVSLDMTSGPFLARLVLHLAICDIKQGYNFHLDLSCNLYNNYMTRVELSTKREEAIAVLAEGQRLNPCLTRLCR